MGVSYPLICHSEGTAILSKPFKSAPIFSNPTGMFSTVGQYLKSHSPFKETTLGLLSWSYGKPEAYLSILFTLYIRALRQKSFLIFLLF